MMYKRRLLELFYVILFLCFLIKGDAQKKENEKYSIHIVGNIKDLPAGYFIDVKYLPHTCVGCPPFTSTKSYQGGFVLNFKIGSPMLVRVHISHQKIEGTEILDKNGDFRLLYLYLTKSGTVKIDGSFKDNSFSFSGTNLQNELLYYTKNIYPVQIIRNIGYIDGKFTSWFPKPEIDTATLRAKLNNYFENRKDSILSGWLLWSLMDTKAFASVSDLESFYNLLSDTVKNNSYCKTLLSEIQRCNKTKIGVLAPNFEAKDTLGEKVSLSDFKGKYVLLNFWSTVSIRNDEELGLSEIISYIPSNKLVVLGFSTADSRKLWVTTVRKHKPLGRQLWNESDEKRKNIEELFGLYDYFEDSFNILVDPNGKIVDKNMTPEKIKKRLVELL